MSKIVIHKPALLAWSQTVVIARILMWSVLVASFSGVYAEEPDATAVGDREILNAIVDPENNPSTKRRLEVFREFNDRFSGELSDHLNACEEELQKIVSERIAAGAYFTTESGQELLLNARRRLQETDWEIAALEGAQKTFEERQGAERAVGTSKLDVLRARIMKARAEFEKHEAELNSVKEANRRIAGTFTEQEFERLLAAAKSARHDIQIAEAELRAATAETEASHARPADEVSVSLARLIAIRKRVAADVESLEEQIRTVARLQARESVLAARRTALEGERGRMATDRLRLQIWLKMLEDQTKE
jgi:hypothetical protein